MREILNNRACTIIVAFIFTATLLVVGFLSFGIWTTVVFASGFLGGFLIWLFVPGHVPFKRIKLPYWLAFAFFILLHRIEENVFKFQEELAKITGNPIPKLTDPALIILVLCSVGGWLAIPYLLKRRYSFGYYLAWTFFASMGITELAHFVFPLLQNKPYSYFPGMASVIVLAPTAWWGMKRLSAKHK